MDPNDPRLKTWGMALGVIVAALALLDTVALRGEAVASASIRLQAESEPGIIEVSRPLEEHRVQISTRRRVRGEYEGQSIAWRLVAPDGTTIEEESEFVARKKRYFDFVPIQQGPHELHLQETKLIGSGRGTARVTVTVNDRRVLGPLLGF